jgi:Ring finger domain
MENRYYSTADCLICQQPTQTFVELFIRLPNLTQSHKDLVVKLEYEFNIVCRRTHLSLEKEIARREFERTWLQEERQLSQAARRRVEKRHEEAIHELENNLRELKSNFERKKLYAEVRQQRRRRSRSRNDNQSTSENTVEILQFQAGVSDQNPSFSTFDVFTSSVTMGDRSPIIGRDDNETILFGIGSFEHEPSRLQSAAESRQTHSELSVNRFQRLIEADYNLEAGDSSELLRLPHTRRKISPFVLASTSIRSDNEERTEDDSAAAARNRSGSISALSIVRRDSATDSVISSDIFEHERQRLEAETAYYQHQVELDQAEIELQHDELTLQHHEQRIRMERSRLEQSFSSIERRVQETKQKTRDRQKLAVKEEKFAKYRIARTKEQERYEQELELLKQDDILIREREECEKQRQETEKVRLKKELNQLVKLMNMLDRAKEAAKLAEEQSSSSQSHETCVVCFESLVNSESELGVVECGHTFHSDCWDRWEKSKRRRGATSIPCPLCNVAINNVCVTMRFGSSLYCNSTSSLAKHFQKEEGRWQRHRLSGLGLTGEASS